VNKKERKSLDFGIEERFNAKDNNECWCDEDRDCLVIGRNVVFNETLIVDKSLLIMKDLRTDLGEEDDVKKTCKRRRIQCNLESWQISSDYKGPQNRFGGGRRHPDWEPSTWGG
jgi:hypothetical protein